MKNVGFPYENYSKFPIKMKVQFCI